MVLDNEEDMTVCAMCGDNLSNRWDILAITTKCQTSHHVLDTLDALKH